MIYLDNGATTLHKPVDVADGVRRALFTCGNPGRGGHLPSMNASRTVLACRQRAAALFGCETEQVVFTHNCTHGLNIAIGTLVRPGARVVISGFEHNAVTRPLYALGAEVTVAGRRLFDPDDTLEQFRKAIKNGVDAAVFTHVSNVFGYALPVTELAELCRRNGVPFVVDAAQSAGVLEVDLKKLGADFIAMPGHKGLLGPQGTGLLLCNCQPKPLLQGGTGSDSKSREMPSFLPDRLEAGTLNVPGIAGLEAGLAYVQRVGIDTLLRREQTQCRRSAELLKELGFGVFSGVDQTGTVSFLPPGDCEEFAEALSKRGVAVRAGLHCAPLAHESAGTLDTGTVRVSFGHDACDHQTEQLIKAVKTIKILQ